MHGLYIQFPSSMNILTYINLLCYRKLKTKYIYLWPNTRYQFLSGQDILLATEVYVDKW